MVLQDQCCGITDKEVSDSCSGQRSGPLYVLIDVWICTIATFFMNMVVALTPRQPGFQQIFFFLICNANYHLTWFCFNLLSFKVVYMLFAQ